MGDYMDILSDFFWLLLWVVIVIWAGRALWRQLLSVIEVHRCRKHPGPYHTLPVTYWRGDYYSPQTPRVPHGLCHITALHVATTTSLGQVRMYGGRRHDEARNVKIEVLPGTLVVVAQARGQEDFPRGPFYFITPDGLNFYRLTSFVGSRLMAKRPKEERECDAVPMALRKT